MKSHRYNTLAVILISVLLPGLLMSCSRVKPYFGEGGSKDPRTAAEKNYDPMSFEGDNEVIPPPTGPEWRQTEKGWERYKLVGDAKDSLSDSETIVYRVQIFTSRFLQEAEVAREELFGKFDEPVYMDFEEPYYKIRIGDFATFEEGTEFLNRVRDMGYTEVWLVKVKVGPSETPDMYDEQPDE